MDDAMVRVDLGAILGGERAQRVALCTSCQRSTASRETLPFFETAEHHAAGRCVCGYFEAAHAADVRIRPHMRKVMGDGHQFTQRPPADHDTYYCGCRGWD